LICGVSSVEVELMNNVLNGTDESIVGLGADYCLALSASLFASDFDRVEIVELSSDDNWLEILDGGEVDVIAGAILDFGSHVTPSNETETGLSGLAFSQPYFYGNDDTNLFSQSKSPTSSRAMATSEHDADWSTFVFWVVAASFLAEENEITPNMYTEAPEVKFFGDQFEWMFRGPMLTGVNYGEMYLRNNDTLPPRAEKNLLNSGSSP
jgi:hypothetical protein